MAAAIHPCAKHLAYFLLFSIPMLAGIFMGKSSITTIFGYISYIDFMNNMGHCNLELIPKMLFSIFPLLRTVCIPPRKFLNSFLLSFPCLDRKIRIYSCISTFLFIIYTSSYSDTILCGSCHYKRI